MITKIKKNYLEFLDKKDEIWDERMTWRGINGRNPKYTTTIKKFAQANKPFSNLGFFNNIEDFFKILNDLSKQYIKWVSEQENNYKKEEYEDMQKFFIGALGEFFFWSLLDDVRSLNVYTKDEEYIKVDFHYPLLFNKKDFGVDLLCVANDEPSVIQVKFWNPFESKKDKISIDIFQKAYCEGVSNDYITTHAKHNTILCTLYSEKNIYEKVKDLAIANNILIIGWNALNESINKRNNIFWQDFLEKLRNLEK